MQRESHREYGGLCGKRMLCPLNNIGTDSPDVPVGGPRIQASSAIGSRSLIDFFVRYDSATRMLTSMIGLCQEDNTRPDALGRSAGVISFGPSTRALASRPWFLARENQTSICWRSFHCPED